MVGNYIVQRLQLQEDLRDEVLCQLVNQTWLNPNDVNAERGWMLLAMCLAVCAPSDRLYPYLLCYVTQHGAFVSDFFLLRFVTTRGISSIHTLC